MPSPMVDDPEEDINTRVSEMQVLNETVCISIVKVSEVNYYLN